MPSGEPSGQPSAEPTKTPITSCPTRPGDTNKPTRFPTIHPSFQPTGFPSGVPSDLPTLVPTSFPTRIPYFIDTLNIESTESGIVIAANVTQESILQCAVYEEPDYPVSINSVIFQNHKAVSVNKYAVLVIPNLASGMEYMLYCVTRDFHNIISMSYGRLLETAVRVKTKGSRKLFIDLYSDSFSPSKVSYNILTMTWAKLPTNDLTILLNTLHGENTTRNENTTLSNYTSVFEPRKFIFSQSSKFTSMKASLPAGVTIGKYTLDFTVIGDGASNYEIVYGRDYFRVVGLDFIPPAPWLEGVIFSDDGSFLIAEFDVNTNRAGLSKRFKCSLLFNFWEADDSSCVWLTNKVVHIFLKAATTEQEVLLNLKVGDRVYLLSNILRRECIESDCSMWPTSALQYQNITAPVNPIEPILLISAPTLISGCSGFVLDLTASEGHGGRPWELVSVVAASEHVSTRGLINNYFSEVYRVYPPSPVAPNHFSPGYNYTFSIQLCNFLKKCSPVATHMLRVIHDEVPNVSILGLRIRNIFRRNELWLRSNAFSTFCGSRSSSKGLEYTWSIIKDGDLTDVKSTSILPSDYILPGYTLKPLSVYNVSLTVYSNVTKLSSTKTVDIFVGQGNIKAVVDGGSIQSLNLGTFMILNASSSYDEDVNSATGLAAGLNYQWSCVLQKPVVNTSLCGVEMDFEDNQEAITIHANKDEFVNTTSSITVVVFQDNRLDEFVVSVKVVSLSSPVITVDKLTRSHSAVDKLKIKGTIKVIRSNIASWAVNDSSVKLREVALTPIQRNLSPGFHAMNLLLMAYSLEVSSSYSFSLECGSSVSTIDVQVAGTPYGGQLISEPEDGIEYFTTFDIAAQEWSDPSLPLYYEIGYLAMDDTNLPLERKSEKTYTRTFFSKGDPLDSYKVRLVLTVFNALNGQSDYVKTILVKPSSTTFSDISERIPGFLGALEGETQTDDKKQIISVFAAPLNAVDCSSAPSCSGLQRQECTTIDNTCGPCFHGYFGDDHSNVPCYLIDTFFPSQIPSSSPSNFPSGQPTGEPTIRPTSSPSVPPSIQPTSFPSLSARRLSGDIVERSLNCTQNSHCGKFEYCNIEYRTCNVTQKSCHHNCFGNGHCQFEEISTGNIIEFCSSQDVKCEPVCNCSSGFSGEYCSLNTTVIEAKSSSRLMLLDALESTVLVDNQDRLSTKSLISTLFNLGRNRHELNITSCNLIMKVVESSLKFSKRYSLPYQDLYGAMYVLNECGFVYTSRKETSIAFNNRFVKINEYVSRMMDLYSEVVFQDVIFGEGDIQLNFPLFKLVIVVVEHTNNSPIIISPAATLGKLYETEFSSVSLVIDKQFSNLQLTLYESAIRFLDFDLISNPLQLTIAFDQMGQLRSNGDEISGMATFTLRNDYDYQYGEEIPQTKQFHTYCNDTVKRISTYQCPNGYIMTHRCDGRIGMISATCPKSSWQPVCSLIDGSSLYTSESKTQCQRLSFTSTSTVCRCALPNFNIHSKERTLEVTTVGAFLPNDEDLVFHFVEDENFEEISRFDSVAAVSLLYSVLASLCFLIFALCTSKFWNRCAYFIPSRIEDESKILSALPVPMAPISGREKVKHVFKCLTEFLPFEFFSSAWSCRRMWTNVVEQHSLTCVFFRKDFSEQCLISLRFFTAAAVLLCASTYVFNVQYPNDKSMCTSKMTRDECLSVRNVFDNDQSLCYWYLSHHINGEDVFSCEYENVRLTGWGLALMVLIVSCLVCPVNYLFDMIFSHILKPPVRKDYVDSQDIVIRKTTLAGKLRSFFNERRVSVVPQSNENEGVNLEGFFCEEDEDEDDDVENSVHVPTLTNTIDDAMAALMADIRIHRQHINTEDVAFFDKNWRWNAHEGNFTNHNESESCLRTCRSRNEVSDEIPVVEFDESMPPFRTLNYLKTRSEIVQTLDIYQYLEDEVLRGADDAEAEKVMFNAFVVDYLGTTSTTARIFASTQRQTLNPIRSIEFTYKVLAVLFVVAANAAFLTYYVLGSASRENSFQISFVIFCVIQFACELFWFEAVICIWMFSVIPFVVGAEIQSAITTLRESANKAFVHRKDMYSSSLNATKWLFVSTKLAESFPHLLASQTILAYHTCYRRLNGGEGARFRYFFCTTVYQVTALLKVLGTFSAELQKLCLYMLQLVVAFGCFGLAVLIRRSSVWLWLPVCLFFYEVTMFTIFVKKKNSVHTEKGTSIVENDMEEDRLSSKSSSDDVSSEMMVRNSGDKAPSGGIDSDLNDIVELEQSMNSIFNKALIEMMDKADERRGRMHNEDNMYQSLGLQRSRVINLEDSVDDLDGMEDVVSSPHSMFMSQRSSSFLREERNDIKKLDNNWTSGSYMKKKSSEFETRSFYAPSIVLNEGSTSSIQTFIKPKNSRVQNPQRVSVDKEYKSDDSSSDGSADELNAIFDSFFNSNERKHDGDDDSVEDYKMLMSTFNFKEENEDSSDAEN